jgi:hypothetical protein
MSALTMSSGPAPYRVSRNLRRVLKSDNLLGSKKTVYASHWAATSKRKWSCLAGGIAKHKAPISAFSLLGWVWAWFVTPVVAYDPRGPKPPQQRKRIANAHCQGTSDGSEPFLPRL